MKALLALSRAIDALNERARPLANWLVLVAVLISAANAMCRYAFDMQLERLARDPVVPVLGDLPALRLATRCCATSTCASTSSTRICPSAARTWIDLVGTVVLPACRSMLVHRAGSRGRCSCSRWRIQRDVEQRRRPDPLAGEAPVPIGFALLALQGVSEIIKRIACLRGDVRYRRRTTRGRCNDPARAGCRR